MKKTIIEFNFLKNHKKYINKLRNKKLKSKKWNFFKRKYQTTIKNVRIIKKKIRKKEKKNASINIIAGLYKNLRRNNKIIFKKESLLLPERRDKFFQKRSFEKQKIKKYYNLRNYKIIKLLDKNPKKYIYLKSFSNNLDDFLETRLDVHLINSNIVRNIFIAKQLISHKKIKVNNKIITKNYILKRGDIVTF